MPVCLKTLEYLSDKLIKVPVVQDASTTVLLSWFQNLPLSVSLLAPQFETGNNRVCFFNSEKQMAEPWRVEAFLQTPSRALST